MALATILVVDDQGGHLVLFKLMLRSLPFTVLTAASVTEALVLLAQARPELLIIDALMPTISGLDLLQRIRADEHWCSLKVILVTAATPSSLPSDAVALADRVMQKPMKAHDLHQVIQDVLGFKNGSGPDEYQLSLLQT